MARAIVFGARTATWRAISRIRSEGSTPDSDFSRLLHRRTTKPHDHARILPSTASRHRCVLLALVFLCGGASIGTELAMSRLLAPYFGTSTFIWANLIGLTLAFLAIGYTIGGRLADRNPSLDVMLVIAGLAGFCGGDDSGHCPTRSSVSRSTRSMSLNVGVFFGSFFASLLPAGDSDASVRMHLAVCDPHANAEHSFCWRDGREYLCAFDRWIDCRKLSAGSGTDPALRDARDLPDHGCGPHGAFA